MVNAFGTGFGTRINNLSGMLFAGIPPGGFKGGSISGKSPQAAQAWMRGHMGDFGWGASQFGSLKNLWNGESGWRWNATNPASGAYGIPQSLPGSKMATIGGDWRTNPVTQMRWGAGYIKNTAGYGTPNATYSKWLGRNPHWYHNGGPINEPIAGVGLSGRRYGFQAGERVVAAHRRGGAAAGHITLEVKSHGASDFDRFMMTWMERSVRVKGGGDVQTAFGES
jgi:hypothetical protein